MLAFAALCNVLCALIKVKLQELGKTASKRGKNANEESYLITFDKNLTAYHRNIYISVLILYFLNSYIKRKYCT